MHAWDPLRQALELRLAIIADTDWRDRDPDAHLAAIADASGQIEKARLQAVNIAPLPPRLQHFLDRASFGKALEFIAGLGEDARSSP